MKKRTLQYLTIVAGVILLILTGCAKWLENEFLPLPVNMYPTYAQDDTLIYESITTGDRDTFLVSDYRIDTMFNGTVLFEVSRAVFVKEVQDTTESDFFYISNEPNGAVFAWGNTYVYFVNGVSPLDTTIAGFDYPTLFTASSVREDSSSVTLHKIYFDFEYGMIKYVFNNLDSYELIERP